MIPFMPSGRRVVPMLVVLILLGSGGVARAWRSKEHQILTPVAAL